MPGILKLVSTPVGTLLGKMMKPSPKMVVQNMKAFGEGESITRYPDLIDAQVIAGSDEVYGVTSTTELKTIINFKGFRSEYVLQTSDLNRISVPTQIVWGKNDR